MFLYIAAQSKFFDIFIYMYIYTYIYMYIYMYILHSPLSPLGGRTAVALCRP